MSAFTHRIITNAIAQVRAYKHTNPHKHIESPSALTCACHTRRVSRDPLPLALLSLRLCARRDRTLQNNSHVNTKCRQRERARSQLRSDTGRRQRKGASPLADQRSNPLPLEQLKRYILGCKAKRTQKWWPPSARFAAYTRK